MLVVVKSFDAFNKRRYSDPWVAKVMPDGRLDFSSRCGGYTGGYHTGDAGDLYIADPLEGAIYAYGQNDRQKKNNCMEYIQYKDGRFIPISKSNLVKVLNASV